MYGLYVIEMRSNDSFRYVSLTYDEIMKHFDYKSIQRIKKLKKLND